MFKQVHLLFAVAIILALGGCGWTCPPGGCKNTVPFKIENSKQDFSPALRVSLDLDQSDNKLAVAEPHTGHTFEFGLAHASGSGIQNIAVNEQVILNNSAIVGPQTPRNKFGMSFLDITYRWRKFPWETPLGFELYGGVGNSWLNLAASTPTQQASERVGTVGIQYGLGLIWRLNPSASIQARRTTFYASNGFAMVPDDTSVREIWREEICFAKVLAKNLSLRIGYADWVIGGYATTSQFQLHSTGPSLTLDWNFDDKHFSEHDSSDLEPLNHESKGMKL
jgi:hypothetical protein